MGRTSLVAVGSIAVAAVVAAVVADLAVVVDVVDNIVAKYELLVVLWAAHW